MDCSAMLTNCLGDEGVTARAYRHGRSAPERHVRIAALHTVTRRDSSQNTCCTWPPRLGLAALLRVDKKDGGLTAGAG
jgi:hypothetical protein